MRPSSPQQSTPTSSLPLLSLPARKSRLETNSPAVAPFAMAESPLSTAAAVAACMAMAFFYVAVLYSPTLILRLPPPTSPKSFMIRRFVCAAVSSTLSAVATFLLLNKSNSQASSSMFGLFGIRSDHLWQAIVFPLSLTSLWYMGSLVSKSIFTASSWEENKFPSKVGLLECLKSSFQRLFSWIQSVGSDVMAWRIYFVAPVTEEMVFRACMIPLLLCGGFKTSTIIFLSPISFSLAHLNHFMELYIQQNYAFSRAAQVVGLQLGYTVIFGSYASFLFIRTGHFLAPVVAHMFCNVMGLPVLLRSRRRGLTILVSLAGIATFFWLLFPATSPELYNDGTDNCQCWHVYCSWTPQVS